MTKTAKQVVGDVIALLRGSSLTNSISGEMYRAGHRPKGSKEEDLIVNYTAGTPDQMQIGVVTLNIYIADIADIEHGDSYVENGKRCEEIEVLAQEWVSSLNKGVSMYYFTLQQTIYTEVEEKIKQHFVVVKLKYELLTE